jgi:hypothetical protein
LSSEFSFCISPVAGLLSNGDATLGLEIFFSQVSIDAQKIIFIAQKRTEKQNTIVTKKTIFVLLCQTFDFFFCGAVPTSLFQLRERAPIRIV